MNRRVFLSPAALASGAGLLFAPSPAEPSPEVPILRFQRRAMATVFEIQLPLGTLRAIDAATAALDLVDALEAQLSAYREGSELCGLNREAPVRPTVVEPRLFELLRQCQRLNASTQGAFDPACGSLIEAWGFLRGPPRVPSPQELQTARAASGMNGVELDESLGTLRIRRPGLKLNLGSIGKGYALDRAAALLREVHGVTSALLIGGSSSILAIGSPPNQAEGWRVRLTQPGSTADHLPELLLKDEALATSANTYRHLEHQGRLLGHLLDPRTGWPGEKRQSATALAPTAAEADALATAFFLLDDAALHRCLLERPWCTAIVQDAAGQSLKILGHRATSPNKNEKTA